MQYIRVRKSIVIARPVSEVWRFAHSLRYFQFLYSFITNVDLLMDYPRLLRLTLRGRRLATVRYVVNNPPVKADYIVKGISRWIVDYIAVANSYRYNDENITTWSQTVTVVFRSSMIRMMLGPIVKVYLLRRLSLNMKKTREALSRIDHTDFHIQQMLAKIPPSTTL